MGKLSLFDGLAKLMAEDYDALIDDLGFSDASDDYGIATLVAAFMIAEEIPKEMQGPFHEQFIEYCLRVKEVNSENAFMEALQTFQAEEIITAKISSTKGKGSRARKEALNRLLSEVQTKEDE